MRVFFERLLVITLQTASSALSKTVGDNAGADCVCAFQDSSGLPDPAGQCFGCTPAENSECHKVEGKVTPGQPDYYCPGPK